MKSLKVIITLTFLILFSFKTFAQIPLSDNASISLLTCGPGDELYSVFGHTAIRIHDPANNMDTVFNFGSFDFDTPNFYLKFVKGDLQYFVSVDSYNDFVYTYEYYNRDIFEQTLNLTQNQKQRIADELISRLSSDKKFYTYKFIDRNCTTMVSDIISMYTGKISLKNEDSGKTYREIIYSYLYQEHFYENLGINLMFGAKTDKELDKLFLPKQLLEGIDNTQTSNGKLSQPSITVYKQHKEEKGFLFWNSYYSFAIIIALLLLSSKNKTVQYTILTISALLGVLFCANGLYSLHKELLYNYNILLFSPLFLILVFTTNKKLERLLIYLHFVFIITYLIITISKPHFILMLPFVVLLAAVLLRILSKNKTERKLTLAENAN